MDSPSSFLNFWPFNRRPPVVIPQPVLSKLDVVFVEDRYLYTTGNRKDRFIMKGIAFPDVYRSDDPLSYNATAWIAVLKQLRNAIPAEALNTVRVYQMDPLRHNYSEFFWAAADLGFYVIVPLTTNTGAGNINRAIDPPDCYPAALYDYGKRQLEVYMQYSNVLAGVVGNEVMNSIDTWKAAPCIKAYARDLKRYMTTLANLVEADSIPSRGTGKLAQVYNARITSDDNTTTSSKRLQYIPLMYASQDAGFGGAITNVDILRLTVDYLACYNSNYTMEGDDDYSIDIFGINIESWCGTQNTFRSNPDGSVGTFYAIFQGLYGNIDMPLVFSELGCSHEFFNRDAPPKYTKRIRDWLEIPVVLHEMAEIFSGFSAYAYWGNAQFNMMEKGPWNGQDLLQPGPDFFNFQKRCIEAAKTNITITVPPEDPLTVLYAEPMRNNGNPMQSYYKLLSSIQPYPPLCSQSEAAIYASMDVELEDMTEMRSYYDIFDNALPGRSPHAPKIGAGSSSLLNGIVIDNNSNNPVWTIDALGKMANIGIFILAVAAMTVLVARKQGRRRSYAVIP